MIKSKLFKKLFLLFLLTGFMAGCSSDDIGHWDSRKMTSIEVTPANPSIAKGTTQQFMATGIYSDNTTEDLTSTVTWSSSNTGVATISNTAGLNGLATAKSIGGPITITATDPATEKTGSATLTVTAAVLSSIGITPVNASIALGTKQQFIATGTYSDATTQDLTSTVTWSSSNTGVATISNTAGFHGSATSIATGGPITITAADPSTGKTATASLTVTAAVLSSIGITPANASIALGTKQQFIATGTYSDATTQDLTSTVTWSSSNLAVASISNAAGFHGLATSIATGSAVTITAADPATGKTGTARLTVTAAALSFIEVTPANASIALGTQQQFIATGTFSDATTQDLTSTVTWSSSNLAVASISNAAGFKGSAASIATGGPVTITATDPATGKTGTARLTVTAAVLSSIEVTPANASIALGIQQQFIATGTYSDATTQDLTSTVTWSSSNLAVATISNAAGFKGSAASIATGGPITITAIDPATGKTATATLTVTAAVLSSIEVTPVNASIALGRKQTFIATGTYSDATTQDLTSSVTWSSSNTGVATISNAAGFNGLATSIAIGGPITITAADPGTGKTATATLTVTTAVLSSIEVTPVNASITLGRKQQFIATGTYSDATTQDLTSTVTWSSSNLAVASISNATGFHGLATAIATGGPITITATDPATEKTGTATLTVTAATLSSIGVTPVNASIALGTQQQFIATGTYSDATTQDLTSTVTWSSSNTGVATISNAAGFNGLAATLTIGGPITITATDSATGRTGTATLTVTAAALSSIEVTPVNASIALGTQQQFIATGTYSDETTQDLTSTVAWSSSNTGVATISNAAGFKGLAVSLTTGGPITITAADPATGKTGTATLTVTAAALSSIGVTPVNASIALGTQQQFIATGTYSDATTQDLTSTVTWSSSNTGVATISNAAGFNGLAASIATGGPITITAADPATGKTGSARLTVTAATLSSIGINPVNSSIALGRKQQFIATGTYSDATTQDLTSTVTWSSSDDTVATISNAAGFKGLADSLDTGGPITITAVDPATGKTGTARLTVTAATLSSIGVTPVNASIALGTKQQFIATGLYSDATTQDLTSSVTWSSSDEAVSTISNAAGFNGLAASLTIGGPITITAVDPATGKTGTARLTVTAATLSSIGVTPVNASIALGTRQQFIATGTYSDFTTQDLTSTVTWSSSDETVATISNAAGFKGLADSLSTGGPITITAVDPATGKTGTARLTVTAATLSSIGVTPVNASIALGTRQQFIATGTYSDFTTQDLTSTVTWSSSDETVATISNAAGFKGLADSLNTGGPITITAVDPATGKTGIARLTVTAAILVSIEIIPADPSIALGIKQPFIATGLYSDATTQNLTSAVTWSSSDETVATISNAAGFKGLATSLATGGPITITGTDPATLIEGTATLSVTSAILVSIEITPADPSIALGTKQPFIATGTYTDSSTQDLTSSVTWSSSDETVATISNAAGFYGEATSISAGLTTITAVEPVTARTESTTLTVTVATLSSIEVTPANPGIPVGETQQYIATGTYSDATTQDLTSSMTWSSSDETIATISNAAGLNGLATALVVGGPITITATDPATLITGIAALTVTIAPSLGAAAPFGGFGGGAGMTNDGLNTVIYGDIGTTGASTTVTGFHDSEGDVYTVVVGGNDGNVTGRIYTDAPPPGGAAVGGNIVTKAIADAARADALVAFNAISPASLPGGIDVSSLAQCPSCGGAGEGPDALAGRTLPPGVYLSATGAYDIGQLGRVESILTLDGEGDENAVWVFQTAAGTGTLTVGLTGPATPAVPIQVLLINGAQSKNVFWYVPAGATIGTGATMEGTLLSDAGISISTTGGGPPPNAVTTTLNGRAIALTASVTMTNTVINVPEP